MSAPDPAPTQRGYLALARHYEGCLARHGDTHRGVDWPNPADVPTRHRVLLDVIDRSQPGPIRLLDFGCGASGLYTHLLEDPIPGLEYSGLDVSEDFVALSRRKYPGNRYFCLDVLAEGAEIPEFDYIVMNGVFTVKRDLSFDAMWAFVQAVLLRTFPRARRGLAFNVMSSHVDWEREDLFHLPLDLLAGWLVRNLTRHFSVRADYGLYEYSVYLHPQPQP